jgi:diaminopimelate epimerase
MDFLKMESGGNDFLVIQAADANLAEIQGLARSLCDRRRGVGADGVAWYSVETNADWANVVIINCDGSPAKICINAFRCVGLRLLEQGAWKKSTFALRTGDREIARLVQKSGAVGVRVPRPKIREVDLPAWTGYGQAFFASTGDSHLILLSTVEILSGSDCMRSAARLRRWTGLDPLGTNVHLIAQIGQRWRIRSYEKGVEGETLSCGSGVLCAATVINGRLHGRSSITFITQGNELMSTVSTDSKTIVTSSARAVFNGRIMLNELSGAKDGGRDGV